jgi:hypothetical protein
MQPNFSVLTRMARLRKTFDPTCARQQRFYNEIVKTVIHRHRRKGSDYYLVQRGHALQNDPHSSTRLCQ